MASPLANNPDQKNLEALYAEILRLPPAEQEEWLDKLSTNYPGQIDDLKREQDYYDAEAGTPMAKGIVAGPSSNPYTHYVAASPLEHAAVGMRQYRGMKGFREAADERRGIRTAQAAIDRKAREAALASQLRDPETALDLWEYDKKRGYRGIRG